jgi:Subtilase family
MNDQYERLTINMGGSAFDPLKEKLDLSSVAIMGKVSTDVQPYVIQFKKSLTRYERTRIQAQYDLKLSEYIPKFAYLEMVTADTLKKLKRDRLLRAVVPYYSAFKLTPGIGERSFSTPERKKMKGLWLMMILFPEADPNLVVEALKRLGISEVTLNDDRKIGGVTQIRFILSAKDKLTNIAEMKEVRSIQEVPEFRLDNGMTAGTIQSGTPGTTPIWDAGIHGENQIIGINDYRVDIDHCFFQDNNGNPVGPTHRKVVGFRVDPTHPVHRHGTFVAGIALGDDFHSPGTHIHRGVAWAARMTYGDAQSLLEDHVGSMYFMLTDAANDGAFIHTNSWHTHLNEIPCLPALYDQIAYDVDRFVWNNEDHLVLGSAGNTGDPEHREELGPPGTAKNTVCVNATQTHPFEMDFGDGNIGPTADLRRKPDLMAPGCGINSAQVGTACSIVTRDCATSWATPAAAGAATLIRQYYSEGFYPTGTQHPPDAFIPSGALLKATLLNGTIDVTGTVPTHPCADPTDPFTLDGYPSDLEGWGLIRLNNVLHFPGSPRTLRVWDRRNGEGLISGENGFHIIEVQSSAQPLKITLVWSDPPPMDPNSNAPMVNNLDLEVESPDLSQTFLGNVFDATGVSTTGGTPDDVNNVEMVLVNNPAPGEWFVSVMGTEVNVGPQGYALVATGDLA